MFKHIKIGVGVLACVLALGLSLSFAQNTSDREAMIDKELSESSGVNMEKILQIPASKKLSDVKEMLDGIRSRRKTVQNKYDELKEDSESSAQRIDCVNKKLLVLKSLTLGAEGSATKMSTALKPPAGETVDEQAAANYYSLVVIADTRSKQEAQNATLCTGGETLVSNTEGGQNTVTIDDDIPADFEPVAEGGRLSVEDLFGDIVDFTNIPSLTPLS